MKKENIAIIFAMIMTATALTGCRMTDRNTASGMRNGLDTDRRYTASQLMNFSLPDSVDPATNQLRRGVTPALTAKGSAINSLTRQDFQGNTVTLDHISSMLGLTEAEFNVIFPRYGHGSGSKAYNIYGKNTGVAVGYDNDNRINKVTVVTDKLTAARWQRELNARYGLQTIDGRPANSWINKRLTVDLDDTGEDVKIIFTNNL